VRSFVFPASPRIVDKYPLKNRGQIIEQQMVHDPIAKIGRENFPDFRSFDDKSN